MFCIWWGILLPRPEFQLQYRYRKLEYRPHRIWFFKRGCLGEWFRVPISLRDIVFRIRHFHQHMMRSFFWFVYFSRGLQDPNPFLLFCLRSHSYWKWQSNPWHLIIWHLEWGSWVHHRYRNLQQVFWSRPLFLGEPIGLLGLPCWFFGSSRGF